MTGKLKRSIPRLKGQ